MEESDYIFDFGPGAGVAGGSIISHGTIEQIKKRQEFYNGRLPFGKEED
jgi:excinuclease ABC subunit A